MYRRGGIIVVVLSLGLLAWSLGLSSVTMDVGYDWDEDRNVQVKTQVCGPAFSVIRGNLDASVPGFRTAEDCRASAWARIAFNGFVGLLGIGVGLWAIRRGWYVPEVPTGALRTLPSGGAAVTAKRDLQDGVNDR